MKITNKKSSLDFSHNHSSSTRNILLRHCLFNTSKNNKSSNNLSSTNSMFSSLSNLVQIESQKPKAFPPSRLSISQSMKCFYQQANATSSTKQNFLLNFVPKRKLNFPKPQNQLKPLNPLDPNLDLNKTIFSFGKGRDNKDYLFFRTNYLLKFSKNSEHYNKIKDDLMSISSDNKDINEYNKIKTSLEKKVQIIFDKINVDSTVDFSTWKDNIVVTYDLFCSIFNMVDKLIGSVKKTEEANYKLKNQLFEQDSKLTFYTNTCQQLNKNLSKSKKIIEKTLKKNKNDSDPVKLQLIQNNNENIIEIFRLGEE